jgi:hypothetical protein
MNLLFPITFASVDKYVSKKKSKAIPVTGREGP